MTEHAFCKLFYNLEKSEVGGAVIFSCFDRARELMRTYKAHLFYEFEGFYRGFTLAFGRHHLTIITTGPGSARVGDAVLALSGTPCRFVFYTGAVGGIGQNIRIGDLVAPGRAIIGDGFSAYHKKLSKEGLFNDYSGATQSLLDAFKLYMGTEEELKIPLHWGDIFTTESLFSETKPFLSELEKIQVNSIDMETSAFFTAAEKLNFPCMALHYVSDLPQRNDAPHIFNAGCRKTYVKLPYLLINFIRDTLFNE